MLSENKQFSCQDLLAALEHECIQIWLRIDAHDHYEDHCLPNGLALD